MQLTTKARVAFNCILIVDAYLFIQSFVVLKQGFESLENFHFR